MSENVKIVTMEGHQKMVDIVFQSGESEAVADLLCAWTAYSTFHDSHPSLKTCAEYLIGLSNCQPFSPRLQQVIIWSMEVIGYQEFQQVQVEGLVGLLDGLHVCIEDMHMSGRDQWKGLFLHIVQSPEGIQHVPHQYWELLVDLVVLGPWSLGANTHNPHIMTSLEDTKEWDKLECWMGVIWMIWSVGGEMDEKLETDEKLEYVTLSLFQQRPGAIQKFEQWMGTWDLPKRQQSRSFQQSFDEMYLNAEW